MLTAYVNENRSNWDDHLPFIMMAYRATMHASTGLTPNMMMFGMENILPVDLMYHVPDDSIPSCPTHYGFWLKQALLRPMRLLESI